MPDGAIESTQSNLTIHELITEAVDGKKMERRPEERYPFFRPLWLMMHGNQYPAFSREISEVGIGLLLHFEMVAQEVQVAIRCKEGRLFQARTQITWCRSIGQGWYISGGRFVDGIHGVKAH